jgi:hypothetical protein
VLGILNSDIKTGKSKFKSYIHVIKIIIMIKEKVMDPEGNEVIILKGPMEFNDEIKKEMMDDWDQYAGMEIDDPEFIKGNWYYVENSFGLKTWYHEAELY